MKWFNDAVEVAAVGEKSAIRALQVWQFLIGKAANHQIVRYEEIYQLMDYTDGRPLKHILTSLMNYCEQNSLPPLTIIAVDKKGNIGDGFKVDSLESYSKLREDVFNFQWLKLIPPSIAELAAARIGDD